MHGDGRGIRWLALLVGVTGCNLIYSWEPLDVADGGDDAGEGIEVPVDVDGDGDVDVEPDGEGAADGDDDAGPDDGGDDDGPLPEDGVTEDAEGGEDGTAEDVAPECGNGVVEPPEECEGTGSQACTTACGSTGTETCVDCSWGVCETSDEICNGLDDDCNGMTDEVAGGFACPDGCCNGTEDPCTCPADCSGSLDPAVPSSLLPANGTRTGSVRAPAARNTQRPLLRWAPATGGCGAITYDVQVDASCPAATFPSCGFPSPEASATGLAATEFRPTDPLAISLAAPVGRRYYWRVRACAGARCSAWSPVRYLDVGRVPGDFDGDGYSDAAVGAIAHTAGATLEGGVFVYGGTAGSAPTTPDWRLDCPGNQADAYFGVSVAAAGDVNADGFDDLLVGAYSYSAGSADEGAAFLYLGGTAGPAALPDRTLDSPAGEAGAAFGLAVGAAGDLDGDGFADFVVAAPLLDGGSGADEGRAYVYLGSSTGPGSAPDVVLGAAASVAQGGAQFGLAVGSAGDLDGDGFVDLAIGAPFRDTPAMDEGVVFLFRGAAAGPDPAAAIELRDPVTQVLAAFGSSVAAAGDVDGDGHSDLLVGAPGQTYALPGDGSVFVLGGSATDPGGVSIAQLPNPGSESGADFGYASAGAGDVDGDGAPDLIVGARYQDGPPADAGAAYYYAGPVSGATMTADLEFRAPVPQDSARFGAAVGSAGDVDGDGFADLLIGEPLHGGVAALEGGAYVFRGSATGPGGTPWVSWGDPDDEASAYFGYSVGRASW
ncbi:MAG: FG-GAP repeat protein [Deltaproteobacteria bacterium]|nr:FG-GAP repeat protein [Deltaproteobacteria bacterium]